jgi:hypothetical protein
VLSFRVDANLCMFFLATVAILNEGWGSDIIFEGDHLSQVWFKLVQQFQKKSYFYQNMFNLQNQHKCLNGLKDQSHIKLRTYVNLHVANDKNLS